MPVGTPVRQAIQALKSISNQYPLAVVDFVLDDLGRPAGKGFEANLKLLILILHLDRLPAFGLPVAANARWDKDGKFDLLLDEFLSHVTDVKPITARQCVAKTGGGQAEPQTVQENIRQAFPFQVVEIIQHKCVSRMAVNDAGGGRTWSDHSSPAAFAH